MQAIAWNDTARYIMVPKSNFQSLDDWSWSSACNLFHFYKVWVGINHHNKIISINRE